MADRFSLAETGRTVREWLDAHPQSQQETTAPVQPKKKGHGLMHVSLAAMGAGQAADAYTTAEALKRPGTREANPLYGEYPSLGRIAATKAATMVPLAVVLDKLYDQHPKVAMSLALGFGALGGMVAARNSKQGR